MYEYRSRASRIDRVGSQTIITSTIDRISVFKLMSRRTMLQGLEQKFAGRSVVLPFARLLYWSPCTTSGKMMTTGRIRSINEKKKILKYSHVSSLLYGTARSVEVITRIWIRSCVLSWTSVFASNPQRIDALLRPSRVLGPLQNPDPLKRRKRNTSGTEKTTSRRHVTLGREWLKQIPEHALAEDQRRPQMTGDQCLDYPLQSRWVRRLFLEKCQDKQ